MPNFSQIRFCIIGLRQQAPGKPAFSGPSQIILSNSRFCVFVSFGGLPVFFFDINPSGPFANILLTQILMDSTLTLKNSAMSSYTKPDETAKIAMNRLGVALLRRSVHVLSKGALNPLLAHICGMDVAGNSIANSWLRPRMFGKIVQVLPPRFSRHTGPVRESSRKPFSPKH